MLTLNEEQWRALQERDTQQFVCAVCEQFLAGRPELAEAPASDTVLANMHTASAYATRVGFTSTPHIVRLLYLAADAPGIHDDPLVDAYLRKPGATPEQRLHDLLAVIDHKLKGLS
jgi:hypothetical protein